MHLRQIKLAGFKSFAEPTVIPTHGRMVGVVGPNGCGKSNVIDAVRWVLGEAQAKHLRGETMQDVIFSGTTGRPPLGRASVELVFDNSLGRAAGAWSQYAEIAVKRVLERDGDSHYYINNTRVRRRDVQDIFLGTGLGPRAYAIIEQGMISRVIESRPEELRVFLEEAAGVSKYKDRRRETENRLADSRANLARTDDIVRELDAQIERLQGQATVAERYRELQTELVRTQALYWGVRRRDAVSTRERHERDIQRQLQEIDAEQAAVRAAELDIERLREAHDGAADAVSRAQGELYGANSVVARLEQQLQYARESIRRANDRLQGLIRESAQADDRRAGLHADLERAAAEGAAARELAASRREILAREQAALPMAESRQQEAQAEVTAAEREMAGVERSESLARAQAAHARRAIEQLDQRAQRLEQERAGLAAPSDDALAASRSASAAADEVVARLRAELARLREAIPAAEARRDQGRRAAEAAAAEHTRAEAQLQALVRLQSRVASDDKVERFVRERGLGDAARLWQSVEVEPGWEDAVESILGMRLNARRAADFSAVFADGHGDAPPGGLSVFRPGEPAPAETAPIQGLAPLRGRIVPRDGSVEAVLADWLRGVWAADDWRGALALAAELPRGHVIVSRDGHLVTRSSVTFFAPQAEIHGALAREREIEALRRRQGELAEAMAAARSEADQAEQAVRARRAEAERGQADLAEAQAAHHRHQLEAMRLSQEHERYVQRAGRIESELAEIREQREVEAMQAAEAAHATESAAAQRERADAALSAARQTLSRFARELGLQRAALQAAQQADQEAGFLVKSNSERADNLRVMLDEAARRITELAPAIETARTELASHDEASCAAELDAALRARTAREAELAAARSAAESVDGELRGCDERRLAAQSRLEPLREKLAESRLKEQEARLLEEQAAEQIARIAPEGFDLDAEVQRAGRPGALQATVGRLEEDIAALGPVNLAALSELTSARERKTWLDAQRADLDEAVQTLEAAIRRIDRETRDQLQETFDKVNASFSTMFPELFGGGQAKLLLTGEEILDAGVQVVAQPPGKKTSSIHLLSGGEKALTAVSLVFSIFLLNPAPFCLLDEVDAPLDDSNTQRFSDLVKRMSEYTQFLFISHNKITMERAEQLIGITMQEQGVSRVVAVDLEKALEMRNDRAEIGAEQQPMALGASPS